MLTKEHLERLMHPTGIDVSSLEFVQHSQNCVYRSCSAGESKIIRISRDRYRTEDEIEAELQWVNYLADAGIKVCRPIALDGKLFHALEIDGKINIVTVFEHAPGEPMERGIANEATFEKLGKLTGSMHAVASKYNREGGALLSRPLWKESRLLNQDIEMHKEALGETVLSSVENLIQSLTYIPKTATCFGILHADINFVNLYQDGDDLWIYDFDNCEYGYFIQDLATILWDSIYCKELNQYADDELNDRIQPFWEALLKGYSETSPMKELNLEHLKQFFLLREAVIYTHYHRTIDLAKMSQSFHKGLDVMKRNIETQDYQVNFLSISKDQKFIEITKT